MVATVGQADGGQPDSKRKAGCRNRSRHPEVGGAKAPEFNCLRRVCLMTFILAVADSLFDLDQDSSCRLVDSR